MITLSTRDKIFVAMFVVSTIFNVILLYNTLKKQMILTKDSVKIKTLLRQSARYGIAALQDENTAIAVLHGNYSAGYLYAITDIYPETVIEEASGINIIEFKNKIQSIQDQVTKRMYNSCPNISQRGTDKFLINISQGI